MFHRGIRLPFRLLGLMAGNFFLLAVAAFVFLAFLAVVAETRMARTEESLRNLAVRELMTRQVSTIPAEVRAGELPDWVWRERHSVLPVVGAEGYVVGAVRLQDALRKEPATPIGQIMHPIPRVSEDADAVSAFRAIAQSEMGVVAVISAQEQLVGILTQADLMRAMQLRQLGRDNGHRRPGATAHPGPSGT